MLRTIIAVLCILIFFIFSLPFLGITWLIGKKWPHAADMATLRTVQAFCRFLLFICGVKPVYIGEENIPADTSVLYIMNHRSYFDILLTLPRFPAPTGYIAKKELNRIPVLRLWLKRLKGLLLDRQNIRKGLKTILAAIDQVKAGISMVIFPEGTRNKNADERELLPFHEGSFKIAQRTGCPIIPVCISHSSEILEDHMPSVHATKVTVEYLEPVMIREMSKEEQKFIGKYVQEKMKEALERNH